MKIFALVFILNMPNGSNETMAFDIELSYDECIKQGAILQELNQGLKFDCVPIDFE